MKQEFDYWFDSDISHFAPSNHEVIYSPKRENDLQWQAILKPEQKQVLDDSIQNFPNVKRKYQEVFIQKTQGSTSSHFSDDSISIDSQYGKTIHAQRETIKQQKQKIKRMQEENKFLKQKIDDLSFRLRETEVQLNKLKYSGNNNITNFQSMKEACLKQISDLVQQQKGQAPQTCMAFKRLKDMTDFDGKLKVDLLNYFMSELLQNIINDSTFYFIDSILAKKGLWRQETSDKQKIRKVDEEFIELMQLKEKQIYDKFKKDLQDSLTFPATKYKTLWKNFYRSYINLLNQGFVVENFMRNSYNKIISYMSKQNFAKLQLFFEKIKLRKDIRGLRQSWFKEIQYDQERLSSEKLSVNKKTKTNS